MEKKLFLIVCALVIPSLYSMEGRKKEPISLLKFCKQEGKQIRFCINELKDGTPQQKIIKKKEMSKFLKSNSLGHLKKEQPSLSAYSLRALYLMLYKSSVLQRGTKITIIPPADDIHEIIRAAYNRGVSDGEEMALLRTKNK